MTSSQLPSPDKLLWTSRQWQEYVAAWGENKPVSEELYQACPGLFFEREGIFYINKDVERNDEVLSYATSLMFRYAIVQICERLNVHPVDVSFSHDLTQASHKPPYIGRDSSTALTFQILVDVPSYSEKTIEQMRQRLSHVLVDIMHKRGVSNPWVYLNVDDVRSYATGYTSPWRMGSNPTSLKSGISEPTTVAENPQILHAWRSQAPNKYLTSAAAAGGLAQRGELYLRWLDGKEKPEKIVPLDEQVIEDNWPSAMKFFHMWAALGIRERTVLREALTCIKPKDGPDTLDTLDLPTDFGG